MSRHSRKNGVPDRWLDYRAVGKRLGGTRFIAFRVPLKQSLTRLLPPSDIFGFRELLHNVNRRNQELGLIIDLTFTRRYYNLEDVPESMMFVKIFTAGHEVPSDDTILSFKRGVRMFLRENADNDKLIGVHCTHGVNRTGYLICRYLIDVDGMEPKAAVALFNSARGHAIERQNYLDDLRSGPKRSNDGMEEAEQEPMRGRADSREERRPQHHDSQYHRSFPPRETNNFAHNGLLHGQPPPPPYAPYRWPPAHPDASWRRPPPSQDSSRSRYPPAEPNWEWRGPPPPPFPRYAPRWDSNSRRAPETEWAEPQMMHESRYRRNAYKDF